MSDPTADWQNENEEGVMRELSGDKATDERDGIDPDNQCPLCGYTVDAASGTRGVDHRPHVGDVSICMQCAGILEFAEGDKGLRIVLPELTEMREYITSTKIIRARMAVLAINLRFHPTEDV